MIDQPTLQDASRLFMRLGSSQSDAYFGIIVWLEVFSPYRFRFVLALIQIILRCFLPLLFWYGNAGALTVH